ncbi:MAG TPA: PH domain-containing protein [Clostridia bacterium]
MDFQKIEKKMIYVRLITRSFFFLIYLIGIGIGLGNLYLYVNFTLFVFVTVLAGLLTLFFALLTFAFPFWIYKIYGYYISENKIVVRNGVIFLNTDIIPIKRVQHIEIMQGPIVRIFGLGSLNIYSAGSVQRIVGVKKQTAELLADQVKSCLDKKLEKAENTSV